MTAQAIDDFWRWWVTANGAFASAFDARTPLDESLIRAMTERVSAIDASLDWEFGPGVEANHHFCLSGKGDPVLRVVAERWLKRAPRPDATWEFYAARQASGGTGFRLKIAGHDVALDDLRFAIEEDEARERLHVRGFHPAYATVTDQELRARILFLGLDNLLGEDGVERWLGRVEIADGLDSPGASYADLRARVQELASRATRDRWAVLKGSKDGKPAFATVNLALKRIDHLLLDMHVAVELPLLAPDEHGLPRKDEGAALNALEDELVAQLGDQAVLAGRETVAGHRIVHLRVMEGSGARALLDRWIARHPERRASVDVKMDPRWEAIPWR